MTRRITLVSPYALSVFGGVQEQVLAMSRELARRGDDVLLVAPDRLDVAHYDTPATLVRLGRVVSTPANGSRAPLALSPRASQQASKAIDEFTPDVVHFHEPFAPLLPWATLRRHRWASVATFHRGGSGPALRLSEPLLHRLSRGLDVSVAVSERAANTVRGVTTLAPRVLFNGFETERFRASERTRGADIVLCVVGRLEARKGVEVAINAVRAHNARDGSTWQLVVLGDGPERARLEALSAHDENVTFLGAASDDDKRSLLRRSNVLLAPALRGESFGLVLLEAMASETAVVASDIDGYRDAASSHATLFAPGDSSSLEAAIEHALRTESTRSIADARAHAQRWSMRQLIDEYEPLYDEAVTVHQRRVALRGGN